MLTNYLVSELRSSYLFFYDYPSEGRCLRPSKGGFSEGCAPRAAKPAATRGKLYPFHIGGTLACHVKRANSLPTLER